MVSSMEMFLILTDSIEHMEGDFTSQLNKKLHGFGEHLPT
jgi:hypothetical protein